MSTRDLRLLWQPGQLVQYDAEAAERAVSEASKQPLGLSRLLDIRRRRSYLGQVVSVETSQVEVIWENGRHAFYGRQRWQGRLEALKHHEP